MVNKQSPQTIRNWITATDQVSERMGNTCRCGSILDKEHMTECRLFRVEVSKVFRELETKTNKEVE